MSTSAASSSRALRGHLHDLQELHRAVGVQSLTLDVDETFARLYFGIDREMLDELRRAGLPHEDADDGPRYCFGDLHYLSLRSGRASAYRRGVATWATTLAALDARGRARVEVEVVPHESAADARILVRDGVRAAAVTANAPAAVIEGEQRHPRSVVPDDVRDVLTTIGEYDFYVLPDAAKARTDLARGMRAGDCESVARVLREDLEALGRECRTRFGLLLAVPYSAAHLWVEVRIDGEWLAFDPLMLSVMKRFGGLDETAWPADRPLNIGVVGLTDVAGEAPAGIISSAGTALRTTYATTIAPAPEP
jgi:Transglutaminase-like superfamily